MDNNAIGIIPARYASSRFPGKPLARIGSKTLIECVYERVMGASLKHVAVATDDRRIADCVESFGGTVVMTSPHHPSGTDRCREAAEHFSPGNDDVIVNIQGDEPFISGREISLLTSAFSEKEVCIATLANSSATKTPAENPNSVKVVTALNGNALYFSRAPIPYRRDASSEPPHLLRHVGIYAYRFGTLKKITELRPSRLELCEKLEQLRWLENGYSIRVLECDYEGIGVDTPEDLELIKDKLIK